MIASRTNVVALSLFAFASFAPFATSAEPPGVKIVPAKSGDAVVEITGIDKDHIAALALAKLTPEEWAKVARLVVDNGTPEEVAKKPAVAGTWSVTRTALQFESQFPLAPGGKYRVFCDLAAAPRAQIKADAFALSVTVPKPPPGPRVGVVAVYPSANRLPENTLRFYIHFSGPVERGDALKYLKLYCGETEVKRPFLENGTELWSDDGTRLTVLLDPGRVKRGIAPREEHGPILEEGKRYSFVIGAAWPDLEGRPLLATHKKTFDATAEDNQPVAPDQWALVAPRANSDAPLMVRLAKPLDHALLNRMLWVVDSAGKVVEGEITVGGGERVVTFAPKKPWARGSYKLIVDARLEDVCGNRVGEPFELDVLKPTPPKPVVKLAERPFTVK